MRSHPRTTRQPIGPEIVDPTALRIEITWQPDNLEGRTLFECADRILQTADDGSERLIRVENARRYAMRHSDLRSRTFTRPDGSTITGAQIEADLQLILDQLAAAGDVAEAERSAAAQAAQVESQRLQAEAERIQREARAHAAAAQDAEQRHQSAADEIEQRHAGAPRREG